MAYEVVFRSWIGSYSLQKTTQLEAIPEKHSTLEVEGIKMTIDYVGVLEEEKFVLVHCRRVKATSDYATIRDIVKKLESNGWEVRDRSISISATSTTDPICC